MNSPGADRAFTGSIPQLYQQHLVPMIFEPYAADLASRVLLRKPSRVLEIAAGTGAVTRHLAQMLPEEATIVATDLNQPMLDLAAAVGTTRAVEWRQVDAMQLPFPDETFDAVVCQFGVMFFPDRPRAFSEAKRVLRPGGSFFFSVWDRLDENEFAETVSRSLAAVFPEDPPKFAERVPYGYYDLAVISGDLLRGGFNQPPEFATLSARSRALSASTPAMALCQGTPLRNEIEARDASRLDEATAVATSAIASRFGTGTVDGRLSAHIVVGER
jgi:SAM-dependent methyltransferase